MSPPPMRLTWCSLLPAPHPVMPLLTGHIGPPAILTAQTPCSYTSGWRQIAFQQTSWFLGYLTATLLDTSVPHCTLHQLSPLSSLTSAFRKTLELLVNLPTQWWASIHNCKLTTLNSYSSRRWMHLSSEKAEKQILQGSSTIRQDVLT